MSSTDFPVNRYKGPVRRTTSQAQLNKLLKDPDAIDNRVWKMLVEGGMWFYKHPKSSLEYQLWTDEKEGTVAFQQYIGRW
jgi:hypothetical protein